MTLPLSRRGFCLILSSPSGAGKTTLARKLLEADPSLILSISATTRRPRPSENDGADYLFVEAGGFDRLRESGGLLEWAEVFGNLYGTPAAPVHDALASGQDVVFDIDWQGAAQLALSLPGDIARVFILPPSRQELERRIYGRAADTEDAIKARLHAASHELAHWPEYDYLIVNADVDASLAKLQAIVGAERLKRHRLTNAETFVSGLTVAAPD